MWKSHYPRNNVQPPSHLMPPLLPFFISAELLCLWRPLSQSAWATITSYHKLRGLNNRNVSLTVLKARSPRSRCQLIWFLGRPLPPACRQLLSHCVLSGEEIYHLMSLAISALIPFSRALLSLLHHLPKAHLLIPPHWGLRHPHVNFGGTQTFSLQQLSSQLFPLLRMLFFPFPKLSQFIHCFLQEAFPDYPPAQAWVGCPSSAQHDYLCEFPSWFLW